MAAHHSAAGDPTDNLLRRPILPGTRAFHPNRRVHRIAGARAAARHAGAPAAAVAARCRNRSPSRCGAKLPGRNADGWTEASARRLQKACWPCSRISALQRCLRPAAAPRFQLSGGWIGRGGRRRWFRGRSTGWCDAGRGPDRRLQDQPRAAAHGSRGASDLRPPARALPRGAEEALIPAAGPRSVTFGPKRLN